MTQQSPSGTHSPLVQEIYDATQSCLTGEVIQNSDQDETTEWLHRNDSYVPRSRPGCSLIGDKGLRKRDNGKCVEEDNSHHKKVRTGSPNMGLTLNSTYLATSVVIDQTPEKNIYTGMHNYKFMGLTHYILEFTTYMIS